MENDQEELGTVVGLLNEKLPIETERLILRGQSEEDFDELFEMNADPDVMRYIGDGQALKWPRKDAFERFRRSIAEWQTLEYYNLAVYEKRRNRYLGWCGFWKLAFLNDIELGYRYAKHAWGKGYATEAGSAMIRNGFVDSDLKKLLARHHPKNLASKRVLEKLGFKYVYRKFNSIADADHLVYSLQNAP
ncbi:MAG: GNAT family N-acetyltransferase [Proteobacteria bacterium]|nr:GNAT family N-acetyltransferase [Pseudomonadota bacterium]